MSVIITNLEGEGLYIPEKPKDNGSKPCHEPIPEDEMPGLEIIVPDQNSYRENELPPFMRKAPEKPERPEPTKYYN